MPEHLLLGQSCHMWEQLARFLCPSQAKAPGGGKLCRGIMLDIIVRILLCPRTQTLHSNFVCGVIVFGFAKTISCSVPASWSISRDSSSSIIRHRI